MKETGFSRVSKNLIIQEITRELGQRQTFFVIQHGSTPANSLDGLRTKLRAGRARYLVIKNSLAKKALDKAKLEKLSDSLAGSCGFAFSSGDPVLSSKILVDFAKQNEGFKIQTGYMNGKILGLDEIKALANLPSREVLLSQVVLLYLLSSQLFLAVLPYSMKSLLNVD